MDAPFCHQRRVEFRDTDAAGIVHFSVFFNYMEEAEHAFLRNLGLDVFLLDGETAISFPRIDKIGRSSVTYRFLFRRDETEIAEGSVTAACCEVNETGAPRAVPIPDKVRAVLEGA